MLRGAILTGLFMLLESSNAGEKAESALAKTENANIKVECLRANESQIPYTVLNDDLVNDGAPSLVKVLFDNFTPFQRCNKKALNDGKVGTPSNQGNVTFDPDGKWTTTFVLELSNSPKGYDISEIRTIAGWPPNRACQKYELLVSRVPDSDKFISMGIFEVDAEKSLATQIKLTGKQNLIESNVSSIKFNFMVPKSVAGGATHTTYREIDIVGVTSEKLTAQSAPAKVAANFLGKNISPQDPLVQITDCARVVRTSEATRMDRFIQTASGFRYDNPGARIRFRTDAKNLSARFKFTTQHTRVGAVNSKGLYTVNGKISGSFLRDPESDEVTVKLSGNNRAKVCDYELIMPYGDSVEFTGLSLGDGKLLPAAARPAFKYVAFGDSITHGFRAGDISRTYPFIIGEKLQWQVVNMGFGSRTTVPSDGDCIAACGGDIISILIGFNDFYGSKPIADYAQDLKDLIFRIRKLKPDTPIFLITPLWSSEPAWAASKIGLKLEDYRKAARQVVAESNDTQLHLIDGLSLMDNFPEMTTDGIHPNDKGFAQIAERLAPILKDVVEKKMPKISCRFLQNLKKGKKQTIVTYGTSLTRGATWPAELQNALDQKYSGLPRVINSGKGAMCSIWGLENLRERVISKNPDVVFIEFSVNDAYLPYKMTLTDCKTNIDTMVERILKENPNCEIILMVMNPMVEVHAEKRPELEKFNDIYRKTAKEKGFLLIDHYPAWLKILNSDRKEFDGLVPDGAHPNAEGCRRIVTPNILKTIELDAPAERDTDGSEIRP